MDLLKKIYKERNIQSATIKGYEGAVKHFLQSQNSHNIESLIQEAITEQKERIPPSETKLKQRLLSFRQYLIDQDFATYTITTYFSKIISIYMHMDVTIPRLKPVKLEKPYISNYDELPTKKELIRAFNIADKPMKAFMTFQLSSGQARAEASSITVGQFLKACGVDSDINNIPGLVKELYARDDVVPLFYLKRLKTGVYYYTCCSPEAVHYICDMLLSRQNLSLDSPLFDMSYNTVCVRYKHLNDSLGLGRVGYFRKLRSHVMRKWHATMLPLSPEQIDMLQGRTRSDIHETYIKLKPDRIKKMYMSVMHHVMLFPDRWMKRIKTDSVSVPGVKQDIAYTTSTPIVSHEYNLVKDIARLELRIEQLEDQVRKLGGNI